MGRLILWMLIVWGFLDSVDTIVADDGHIGASGPAPIRFEMKYRGLGGDKDGLRYNLYLGDHFKQKAPDSFTENFETSGKFLMFSKNYWFEWLSWVAFELVDRNTAYLHIDMNNDGTWTADERLEPIAPMGIRDADFEYVTPDIDWPLLPGLTRKYRFLVLSTLKSNDDRMQPSLWWSPHCIWEGKQELDGKSVTLALFDYDINGCFRNFGEDKYILYSDEDEVICDTSSLKLLSQIIFYEGKFYSLSFEDSDLPFPTFRAVLGEAEESMGRFSLKVNGPGIEGARMRQLKVRSVDNWKVAYYFKDTEFLLPSGDYRIDISKLIYKGPEAEEWLVNLRTPDAFRIDEGATLDYVVEEPKVNIIVKSGKKWLRPLLEPRTSFSNNADLYITQETRGRSGELLERIYKITESGDEDMIPIIRIMDSSGKEVASGLLKYG